MKCPVCNVELKMAERQGVEIDYCPQCRGVWLDRGELDKIIEKSSAAAFDPRRDYDDDDDRHERRKYDDDYYRHGYGKHKRKSFLGEIFDFD
ncbi:MAG: zf-TFIIB domain-containing protein [candidate division KSB1 bacterium]|nr:zf-TFIIB domain-containing protein [candidate division KSB1 bacterium]MDZ7368941.1 zf-TFIIB domain-containing protein [candidate division KSB1 bacterium]MDZ7406929.1 zf-TFIIB domain-containing protein [candidate division KSB1 bacterium]